MSSEQFIALFRATFPAPQFNYVNDAVLELYYNQALAIFGMCSQAMIFLAAHLITLDKENGLFSGEAGGSVDGGNGEVTSEKVGQIQVNMVSAAENARDVYFQTTPYGRKYIQFRNACPSWGLSIRTYPTW